MTSKQRLKGNFVYLAAPHIIYIILAAIGLEVAILREGLNAALFSNLAWVLFNISAFAPFIAASLPASASDKAMRLLEPRPAAAQTHNSGTPPVPSPRYSVIQNKMNIKPTPRR